MTVPPYGQFQLQFQQLAWWSNPEESGTQEERTYREEAAERDDAAVAVVVVAAAGQKPVGTDAPVREFREGEEGEGNEGQTFGFMAHNDGNKMMTCC